MQYLFVAFVLGITFHRSWTLVCITCNSLDNEHCKNAFTMTDQQRNWLSQECQSTEAVCRTIQVHEGPQVIWSRGCSSLQQDPCIGNGSRIELCATCSTDQCNTEEFKHIKLGIMPTDGSPFDYNYMKNIKQSLFNAINYGFENTLRPQFIKVEMRTGFLIATVANNNMTDQWLHKFVEDKPYKIVSSAEIPKTQLVKGYFAREYNGESQNVLRYIEAQNNLSATKWMIVKNTLSPNRLGETLVISVDEESANQLKLQGGYVYCGLSPVLLSFVDSEDD